MAENKAVRSVGKPALPQNLKRRPLSLAQWSPDEVAAIDAAAELAGESRAQFVRSAVMGRVQRVQALPKTD